MVQGTEIETTAAFDECVARGGGWTGAVLQSVDLTARTEVLRRIDPAGAIFLGCRFTPEGLRDVRDRGGLIFPTVPDSPVDPYRARLYDAPELYTPTPVGPYAESLDARVYAWTKAQDTPTLAHTLVTSLHDHAIGDALADLLSGVDPHRVVGIMGGHAVARGSADHAAAVELGAALTRAGHLVVTGGGPGAMEAANLGAMMASHTAAERAQAGAMLAAAPSFRPSVEAWAQAAFAVVDEFGPGSRSIGIPTWFYGHEPPNVLASDIAKYFSNALREDVLLASCRGGLIYLPGAAGTVQELFQAVTANYYAATPDAVAPLILVGREQWTRVLPAWPLLQRLGEGRPMGERLLLVDTVEDAFAALAR